MFTNKTQKVSCTALSPPCTPVWFKNRVPCAPFDPQLRDHSLVLTSRIISAEAWQPVTMCLVHTDRSWVVSARNRWASMPSRVPVRVAKDSSVPRWGDPPRSGPEWTSLSYTNTHTHTHTNTHVTHVH